MSAYPDTVIGDLRKHVEEVAAAALTLPNGTESAASLIAMLSSISEQAAASGLKGLHRVIEEIWVGPDATAEQILAGIPRLQQELDSVSAATAPQPQANPLAADAELISDFIVEARDHLATVEAQLIALEQDAANPEAVHTIFRSFHTLKGLAGFLDLPEIQKVAHETETLLNQARNGNLTITPPVVDVVLESTDYVRTEVARVEKMAGGASPVGPAPNAELIARIQARMRGEPAQTAPAADVNAEPAAEICAPPAGAATPESGGASPNTPSVAAAFVKVNTSKLDFLVDMVGELVIAQSMVHHDGHLSSIASPKLQRNLAQLARITGEVQKTAMAMRMVPIGQLFQRSVRLVRDLTRKSGKKAELEISGEDTELDRTIVEELSDPLMHMIRNSMDHGIEEPEERGRLGKSETAKIHLRAYHQAGHIVIEVKDDGRGLDRQKILNKARERGLLQDGGQLSDLEVFNLIFEPGFSTADKVTEISGRGVGMDVVRRHIQKMRGRIDIESQPGMGTTFLLKLPLTLAIIDGLVVGVGGERYVVPIFVVRGMFRPSPHAVSTVGGVNEMVLVRGNLLPLVRLHRLFGVEPRSSNVSDGVVILAESGRKRFCLLVDELIGKQEVVIKSLGETFKSIAGVAGGAILGDGRVALILDIDTIFSGGSNA